MFPKRAGRLHHIEEFIWFLASLIPEASLLSARPQAPTSATAENPHPILVIVVFLFGFSLFVVFTFHAMDSASKSYLLTGINGIQQALEKTQCGGRGAAAPPPAVHCS